MSDLELTNSKFEEFINNDIAVVDFWAPWCMPCLMVAPIIEELSEKFKGKIGFGKVNVDENQEIAAKFKISVIPTLVIFKKGKPIDKITGALPADVLEKKITGYLE